MAALRIFARSAIPAALHPREIHVDTLKYVISPVIQFSRRWASFKTSPSYSEDAKYTDYEISKDPKEWIYVERLLKSKYVPIPPKTVTEDLPSGWKPRREEAKKLPYFVDRTKNHMQSVHLHIKNRGLRRLTVIKKIQGDIVAMEAELKQHLQSVTGKGIGSQINEPGGVIKFRGDYVSIVKAWLESKGF